MFCGVLWGRGGREEEAKAALSPSLLWGAGTPVVSREGQGRRSP